MGLFNKIKNLFKKEESIEEENVVSLYEKEEDELNDEDNVDFVDSDSYDEEQKKEENKLDSKVDSKKDKNDILSFGELMEQGKQSIQNGNKKYQDVKIDTEKMSVLIFTSGTTNTAKGVMLSQKNITSNIMGMAKMSKMYENDVLLSFLHLPAWLQFFGAHR